MMMATLLRVLSMEGVGKGDRRIKLAVGSSCHIFFL